MSTQAQQQQAKAPRFRFNIKYIGSAILHKNFTLPMLEWIVKDIKRQTVRGARSTSSRQITIPVRDVVFEIQPNRLTAISCKDGNCVFVHPTHCVSKYAQLQHDQTHFSYLIRDNKDSPYFCHVFQAKSASKVHDIFRAIREVTTRTQLELAAPGPPQTATLSAAVLADPYGLQKSASYDCGPRTSPASEGAGSQRTGAGQAQQFVRSNSAVAASSSMLLEGPASESQFENSYQFEVMFVKKVKLQCRRVPVSFVDDALETLKSYEVLKGGEAKTVGKRIISASVDERQEYDEACISPPPPPAVKSDGSGAATSGEAADIRFKANIILPALADEDQRRGSSVSLINQTVSGTVKIANERESRSCQQSPTKLSSSCDSGTGSSDSSSAICTNGVAAAAASGTDDSTSSNELRPEIKKHQSMDSLKSLDWSCAGGLKQADGEEPANYANDFSPYNTITSTDLNERIAAIPVVSSSVSLDHETRQRLARQVRETIMATAASIKKEVYASGDKLDSSSSSKALDSLSCTVASSVPAVQDFAPAQPLEESKNESQASWDRRRASAGLTGGSSANQAASSATNNFDLFRRASARQVVKNRTMLLLIGKGELCTISIDKHQVLFSKSYNSIVHCLQGSGNRDHFGLICRDSGKINPNTESYAGFIFKCQSEKVVREIMGALKQVIYSSHHNCNSYHSPYNPLNSIASHHSPNRLTSVKTDVEPTAKLSPTNHSHVSLAAKRGFANPIELGEPGQALAASTHAPRQRSMFNSSLDSGLLSPATPMSNRLNAGQLQNKDPVRSMFCDNCPLYWYHRLCCDVEFLPAEASKAIILRRIDSSLSDKEQDEIYSRFSEFKIDSIDEHNEIFMSLLRHLNERKQLKHNQSQAHMLAMAKLKSTNSNLTKQLSLSKGSLSTLGKPSSAGASSSQGHSTNQTCDTPSRRVTPAVQLGHQRSGSSGGSLAHVLGQSSANHSIADAGSVAIDNLMRAKNSISVSIENLLKRRGSTSSEFGTDPSQYPGARSSNLPSRSGSFKSPSCRPQVQTGDEDSATNSLKRSQSTSDYSGSETTGTWRDSLLSRKINDDLAGPFSGLFRRRSSTLGSNSAEIVGEKKHEARVSAEVLNQHIIVSSTQETQPSSPSAGSESRFNFPLIGSGHTSGGPSPSSMLSGAFWKKSIFDKIRQPGQVASKKIVDLAHDRAATPEANIVGSKRSREELRSLWRKAILEQITLLKMDRQNRKIQCASRPTETAPNVETSGLQDVQKLKLNYRDVFYARDAISCWDKLLRQDPTIRVNFVEVARHVRLGSPKQRRGEIWMFLMNQYQLRHGTSFQPADNDYSGNANQTYRDLLSQLSVQQHEIFVDIGRTFPTHPYYSQYLSIGQLSLFNLLKAYSLLDREVGYCQGLSFVAGILLLHVESEDEAFELMRHLLFNFSLRKQYLPSMKALHLQLYQITRLLRDFEYDLFDHFDRHDISPSLYAAPWFLTLFASQFPLGFVARLLDLIYLMGIEAIFRVSLNLLNHHRTSILACNSLESTMDFMKTDLVKISDENLAQIFDKSFSLDLRNKLIEYEIEYTFYCAEDRARFHSGGYSSSMQKGGSTPLTENKDNGSPSASDETKESTSVVADATATVIIQHLLASNHLKSLRSNYTH